MFIPVVYGSVRSARVGIRAARMLSSAIEKRGDDSKLIDPVEFDLPLLDKRIFEFDEGQVPPPVAELSRLFRRADAFVFVTAEYNHCIPPALKNLMDHFGTDEFGGRPAGIVSYSASRFGGVRAAEQMRLLLPSFGAVTIPNVMSIPEVGEAIDEEGSPPSGSPWPDLTSAFLNELRAWARAAPGTTRHDGMD